LILVLGLLAACAAPTAPAQDPTSDAASSDAESDAAAVRYPVTITHALGEETFDAAPERVVVIREELLEILLVLGVQPVGYGGRIDMPGGDLVTDHPYLAQDLLGTPTYIGQAQAPSLERIAVLNPDMILMPGDGSADSSL